MRIYIKKRIPFPKRFWDRVEIKGPDECWPFLGRKQHKGHGEIYYMGRYCSAHRISWELTNGPIPEGKWILHHCDNPPCCNPKHLYPGTALDNARDACERHRWPDRRGSNNNAAKLTESQASEIRRLYASGKEIQERLAVRFGVGQGAISAVINRKTFQNVE